MRDRLIELLYCAGREYDDYVDDCHEVGLSPMEDFDEMAADYLLEHGVIVPPCKVGQTVYVPWRYAFQRGIATVEVQEIKLYDTNPSHCMFLIDMESDNECFNQSFGGWKTEQSIGKTVFLTREEAEKALKEREGKG
ncbi:MAG: hypothetical protein IKA46_02770 [Clostridia bacterium]|nr:hypothetical protein [Clostridia bacterium]